MHQQGPVDINGLLSQWTVGEGIKGLLYCTRSTRVEGRKGKRPPGHIFFLA